MQKDSKLALQRELDATNSGAEDESANVREKREKLAAEAAVEERYAAVQRKMVC